jgi:FkbM family methyltransferase
MSFTWLYLKIRKKSKAVYRRSMVAMRKKIANPEKRIKLNRWYNKMSIKNKALFHRLYSRLFQNIFYEIQEGDWVVDFAGRSIRTPLRNKSLWLDWDLAVAITGHDPEIKATYENMIRSGNLKVVFDIGANYGTHSLLFLTNGIKTISFEPIPFLKKEFEYLCDLNQVHGAMENVAMGDKNGTAILNIPANESWNSAISDNESHVIADNSQFEKIEVPVITVDEFVSKSGLHPDFIKIDTEGYEINVLKGALNTIKETRPLIIFETNKFPERKILWDFFMEVKYNIQELPYKPGQQLKKFPFEVFSKKGSANYIAVPDPGTIICA